MNTLKTALITGASKGIGFEIARQLGKKGFHIFLTARDSDKGNTATQQLIHEGIRTTFVELDVAHEPSIQQAYERLRLQTLRLDVLINNAAVLLDNSYNLINIPSEIIHKTIQINSIGPLLVTRILDPLLFRGSRIINISSGGGAISQGVSTFAPVYCISKTALSGITLQLAQHYAGNGIPVNAVCPGWVKTDMGGIGANRSVEKGAETPVWLATEAPISLTGKFLRDKKEIPW
ncbi:MAG: SDR family NAD(P)-dependent oxidoreductase [Bacteroidia bacterium]|nr:SDR family NAD(P)-dependent oxidoreductase [Bacteroidia bacterium]